MTLQSQLATLERPRVDNCRHHWLIDIANGPTSRGRCKLCGAERDFYNTVEDVLLPKDDRQAAR